MISSFFKTLRGNKLDRLLRKAAKADRKRFLIVWNRGLGDIALGLYALVHRIKTFITDAHITFITRKELKDAFHLLENINIIIGVPWWQRGTSINIDDTLQRLSINKDEYDVIFDSVNPTKWFSRQIGKLVPKLCWKNEYDNLWERFNLHDSFQYIGVHIGTETEQFYGYKKDWPIDNWIMLFKKLSERPVTKIILFGINKTFFPPLSSVIDLRGETSVLEMLSIIKNRCNILIAPDGGVLSIIYYLDVSFPITVISLWGDDNQGIIKQAVPSPNEKLIHIPIVGRRKNITNITVDDVILKLKFVNAL